jgi:hypothetical protein
MRRSWTLAEDGLLGTLTDREFARQLNMSYTAVRARRHKKGIPVCNPQRKLWRPQDDKILGFRPDGQIARRLGRSINSVKNRRKRLGIRVAGGQHRGGS